MSRPSDTVLISSRRGLALWDGVRAYKALRTGAKLGKTTITVVVPVYNLATYVADAVRSLLQQSHTNLELWLLDDASTDDTIVQAQRAIKGDNRCRIYRAARNSGPYVLKNWALQASQAPYVCFQDGDDIAHPDRLRLQLGAMRRRGAKACTVRWDRFDETGHSVTINGKRARLAANSLMIERAPVLEAVGYFDRTRMAADTEYLGRLDALLPKGQFIKLPEVAISGLFRSGSITTSEGSGMHWQQEGLSVTRTVGAHRKRYLDAATAWHDSHHVGPLSYDDPTIAFDPETPRGAALSMDELDMTRFV